MPQGNLRTLAHEDCTASSGKWHSITHRESNGVYDIHVRSIYHYGTLMMTLHLDEDGSVLRTNPRERAILYERPGGSQSDKCGLSRIRQSLYKAWDSPSTRRGRGF